MVNRKKSFAILINPMASLYQNLWSLIEAGGPLMYVLALLAWLALTLIIERSFFLWKNRPFHAKRIDDFYQTIRSLSEEEFLREIDLYLRRVEKGLRLLYGIGNVAPLVGFLGTVLGMIGAFSAIGKASQVDARLVASSIEMALVTTASGLIIAVPSLLYYQILMHFIDLSETRLLQKRSPHSDETRSRTC